jgi:DNA gyrase subunit A
MVVDESDEVFAIASNGVVIRTKVTDVRATGRDTQGVRLMNLGEGDTLISIARAPEREDDVEDAEDTDVVDVVEGETSSDVAPETNTEG